MVVEEVKENLRHKLCGVTLYFSIRLSGICSLKVSFRYFNVYFNVCILQGWTKPNAFHVCITSYKLVIQDHQAFRRKKWKYFILDEVGDLISSSARYVRSHRCS